MPEKYMAETGPTEEQNLNSRTGGQEEDAKKKEEEQKKSEREKARRELVIELKVDSNLAKEVKELIRDEVYEAKARDGTKLSKEMLSSGDFAVGLRDFDHFIVVNVKTGQAFEVSTAKKDEDTRQAAYQIEKIIDGVKYQIEYDAAKHEMSRKVLNQEPVKITDAKGIDWLVDPNTGMKRPLYPMAGGAPDDAELPYAPGVSKEEMEKLVNQKRAEALAAQAAEKSMHQERQKVVQVAGPDNVQVSWEAARRIDPTLPAFGAGWQGVHNADPEDQYKFKVAMGIPIIPTQEEFDRLSMKLPSDSGRQTEVEQHARHFKEIYAAMVSQGYLKATGNPNSVDDLSSDDREKFFANLHNINEEFDMNQILQRVAESPEFVYPGQELAAVLRIDKKMGLGGDLVRRAVEQRMAVEEYDDSKQMRQETVGALHNAIGQYLGSEPALQQELRLLVYVRMKLHEFTILARYVGVDKLADQMSNFYQDEFRVIMDTRLFREATQMLESEYGAYFRKGKGFKNKELEYKYQRAERYEKNTIKMALLLMPELKDSEWKNYDRDTAIYAARKFVEKTNLYRRDNKIVNGLDRQATWDEVLDEMVKEKKLNADKKQDLKVLLETKSTLARMTSNSPGGLSFDQAYRVARAGFDMKDDEDQDTQKNTPMNVIINKMNIEKMQSLIGRQLSPLEKQNLVNAYNEANRAFGLSIRTFDIYGASTRYDCLLDKKGVVMKPKTAILKFPDNLTWVHILKESKYSRPFVISMIPDLKAKILREFPDPELKAKLAGLTQAQDHEKMEEIFKDLSSTQRKNVSDYVDHYLQSAEGRKEAEKALSEVLHKFKGKTVDLSKLDAIEFPMDPDEKPEKLDYEEKQLLNVVRGLSAKTIRDTRTRAMREMMFSRWDEIDRDDSTRGNGIREFRKAMWNQVYKSGINADTPGKKELLRYTSTDIVSLYEDNGRTSVWDQMSHWDDDFANMKKWCEELKVGNNLRKNYAEGDPGMFNSTTKLNDPVESLKKYKDMIGDWTQEHRVEFLDHLSQAPIEYIAKYNYKNQGYKNADTVRVMNLMNDMFWNSVMSQGKKRRIEKGLYGGHYLAQMQYTVRKAGIFKAIFGAIEDIFKESTKTLTK